MATYNDEGIVLRRIAYGDSDSVLTILTKNHGKIGAIAKGVRRPKSKLSAHVDLFSRNDMQLAKGRGELDVLTQAQRNGAAVSFPGPLHSVCASVCAECIDVVLEPHHPIEESLYELAWRSIAECGIVGRNPRAVMVWFIQTFINAFGWAPSVTSCAHCDGSLAERDAYFSASTGGLLCEKCENAMRSVDSVCSTRVIKILRTIIAGDATLYARLAIDEQSLATLETLIETQIEYHCNRQLQSLAVVRSLLPTVGATVAPGTLSTV